MDDYERGRWDMFVEVTSIFSGKQVYFMQDNGMIYSRDSGEYLTREDAYNEFFEYLMT